ncbi:hypothetical protein APHAL10511_003869 [Amanita phalloides]|nr:hypothetical protein APHAL10511_003869 [Amanita phalloides]
MSLLKSGSVAVNSQDDVKAAIRDAKDASTDAPNFQAAAKSTVVSYRNDLSMLPKKPYDSLGALTKHVVQVAEGKEKPDFGNLTKNTTDAFKTALDTTGRYINTLGKKQEALAELGAKLANHKHRLESAKRFLDTEKSNQERRRNDADSQKSSAERRIQETSNEIDNLQHKIRNRFDDPMFKEAMKMTGLSIDPRMRQIYGTAHRAEALLKAWNSDLRSNETKKGIYERDRNNAQNSYDDAVRRIREADDQIKEANGYIKQISQESSRTDAARGDVQATTSSLIRARGSLSQIHSALADMTAIAKETFRPRYHRTFARSIMRILLLTPDLPAFNRCLGGIIQMLQTLPAKVLDGQADPDDYGTPEPPLRGLLQEVQTLSRRNVN